nr:MAG TPA: hypothetical protein [Caudoviricetes sp.]
MSYRRSTSGGQHQHPRPEPHLPYLRRIPHLQSSRSESMGELQQVRRRPSYRYCRLLRTSARGERTITPTARRAAAGTTAADWIWLCTI